MSQPGNTTDTPSPSRPSPMWAATDRPDTDATAPLWFGDREASRSGPAPAPPSTWHAPDPASIPPVPPPSRSPRTRRTWPGLVAVSLLSAGLASGGTYAAVRAADDQGASAATSSSAAQQSPSGATTSGTQEIRQVNANAPDWTATAAAATPSVVAIRVEVQGGGAQGSGVVIDEQGHILTNNHVVDGAVQGGLKVSLSDGRTYAATIAGTDPSTDLAVVTITNPPSDLKPIAMGDSAALKVGDPVMAVGNPLGLASTVTTGIVSALNRPVTTGDEQSQFGSSQSEPVYTNAVQTSAAINPGNSGGALVDANGRLVGINSSIASTGSSGGNIGIGFAIPVNEAKVIADQLISTGSAQHAYLGVKLQDGEGKDGTATRSGALIASVSPNTPAANAGLQQGDIVIGIKGVSVESMDSLIAHIRAEKVGSTVPLTVLRNGSTTELSVTLAARPQS